MLYNEYMFICIHVCICCINMLDSFFLSLLTIMDVSLLINEDKASNLRTP